MRALTLFIICLLLGACGIPKEGKEGASGKDGAPGIDGQSPIIVTQAKVPAGQCVEVAENIWVENIHNGAIYDVYYNDECKDSKGEYCDNVEPSFGNSGRLGPDKPGGGEHCLIETTFISGQRYGNDLSIVVMEFNTEAY